MLIPNNTIAAKIAGELTVLVVKVTHCHTMHTHTVLQTVCTNTY
jgi:hypothetical protein